jgi:hypothetical protein
MVKMVIMSILLRLIYCSDKAKTGIHNDELYVHSGQEEDRSMNLVGSKMWKIIY